MTNDSQYGWTVIQVHRDEAGLYLIEDKNENRYHIPCHLWDSLKSATQRAESYRKSRDYYKESRDSEKVANAQICQKLVESHLKATQDLHNEIDFLHSELSELENRYRDMKAFNIVLGILLVACIVYLFLI